MDAKEVLRHKRHLLLRQIARDISKVKKDAAQVGIDCLAIERDFNVFIRISEVLDDGKHGKTDEEQKV